MSLVIRIRPRFICFNLFTALISIFLNFFAVSLLEEDPCFFHFFFLLMSIHTVASGKKVHQRRHCFSALSIFLFCSARLAEAPRRGQQGERSEAALCVPEEANCSEVTHPKGGACSLSRGQKEESSSRRERGQRLQGSKLFPAQRLSEACRKGREYQREAYVMSYSYFPF